MALRDVRAALVRSGRWACRATSARTRKLLALDGALDAEIAGALRGESPTSIARSTASRW